LPFQVTDQSRSNPKHGNDIDCRCDMNLLKELHEHGSVNTMKKKHDLYNLTRLNNEKLFRMRGKIIGREDKSFVATVVVMPITIKLIKIVLIMHAILTTS
jgi:ABC-type oligopeptide transport system ATPase subunit